VGESARAAWSAARVTLEANGGLLLGGAVDSPIGDLNHPPRQVPLQLLEGGECSPGQCIVFDVSAAAFDFPLRRVTEFDATNQLARPSGRECLIEGTLGVCIQVVAHDRDTLDHGITVFQQ
jgi:hypothetical protein